MANPVNLYNGYRLYIDNTTPTKDGNGYEVKCTLRKTGSWGSFGNYSTDWWIEIDGVRRTGSLSSFSDSTSTIGTYTRTVPVTPGAAARTITIKGYWNSEHGSVGSGTPSDTVALPRIPYPDPPTPTGLSATGVSTDGIDINWKTVSGRVTGYRIAYRKRGASTWDYTTDSAPLRYLRGLATATEYEFRIEAYNEDGSSGYSGSVYETTLAAAPSAPGAPSVTSSAAGAFTATWSAPSSTGGKPITGYDLRYQVNGGTWVTVSGVTSGYTKTGLTAGATVGVQVLAKNVDATSAYSGTGSGTMDAAPPTAPAAPALTSAAPGEFTATWSAPSSTGGKPITGYDLQYRVDGGSWTTVPNVNSGVTMAGLTPGGAVEAQVRAKNADATGAYSTSGSVSMLAGGRVKSGSAWADAITWVRMSGVWVKCRVWVKTGGVWTAYR